MRPSRKTTRDPSRLDRLEARLMRLETKTMGMPAPAHRVPSRIRLEIAAALAQLRKSNSGENLLILNNLERLLDTILL